MRTRILGLALLAGLAALPALGQTGAGTPSSQQIIERLTRGIRVPPTGGQPPVQSQDTTAPVGVDAISLTVNFASGSTTISAQAERVLAELGQALASRDLAQFRFRIEGHTDTVGDPAMNQALSERRAAAVATWLVRRYNIAPERLEAVGFGESQLLVNTPDGTAEQRNRRVQVLRLGG